MNSGSDYAGKSQESEESRLTLGISEEEKGACMDMVGQKEEQGA